MELSSALSGLSPHNFSLKRFFIFFPKKPAVKKFVTVSHTSFSNFQKTELFYIYFRMFFLYFGKGIFRTRSIFRTLIYPEHGAYSENSET